MNSPVIIGGSAGSFAIIFRILPVLSAGFDFPLIICVHRLRTAPSGSLESMFPDSKIHIHEILDQEQILPGKVYIAPPNKHLLFRKKHRFSLTDDPPNNYSRPSIDITMKSAATLYGSNLIGILFSGANSDGAEGMKAIHEAGGVTIIQDPKEAEIPIMPQAAVDSFAPGYILSADKIINFIEKLTKTQ